MGEEILAEWIYGNVETLKRRSGIHHTVASEMKKSYSSISILPRSHSRDNNGFGLIDLLICDVIC